MRRACVNRTDREQVRALDMSRMRGQSRSVLTVSGLLVLLLALGGLLRNSHGQSVATGSTWANQPRPRELLEQRIHALFPRDADYRMSIETATPASDLLGRFKSLRLQAGQTTIGGLPIDSASVSVDGFSIDLPRLKAGHGVRLLAAQKCAFQVVVPERGLNWLLANNKKLSKDRPPVIALAKDAIIITGHVRSGLFSSSVSVKGNFVVRNGCEVHFLPHRLSVGFFLLPDFLTDLLVRRVNPVATLNKMTGPQRLSLQLRKLELRPGALMAEGGTP